MIFPMHLDFVVRDVLSTKDEGLSEVAAERRLVGLCIVQHAMVRSGFGSQGLASILVCFTECFVALLELDANRLGLNRQRKIPVLSLVELALVHCR